jgi:hypothetical protein
MATPLPVGNMLSWICRSFAMIWTICALLQVGPDDLRRNALADLLVQLAKRDAFHQLRTVEQVGPSIGSVDHICLAWCSWRRRFAFHRS